MILRTVRMGPEAGEGVVPVVLLHGLFGAASNWGRIQRALAEEHPVLALDARNHGGSPHDPAVDYATMAQDVLDTLDEAGVARAAVIGHSMGGKTAMHLALAAPERVERLLVADVSPVTYDPHFRGIAAAMQAIPLVPGLTRAAASAAMEAAAPDVAMRGFLLQNLRFGDAPSWRIGLDEIAAALPAIERWDGDGVYEGRVLVLRGERSDYVLPEHRAVFRALFPAAVFATLRDAGHWLHADAPDAFLETVRAFLARPARPVS